ncbi:MAG: MFS transporter [Gammaproteobacteria bacterium]|nr:MFS transporter [Gammaproteobacteria bacterium]
MTQFKVILLLSYICIASFSAAIITPALPQIKIMYHLSSGSVEWIISIFLIGYVIGQLIYGPIANRFGRIKALQIGLTINLIGIVICIIATTFTSSYSFLLFGRLITALGAASGLACTFMLINELLPPDRVKETMAYSILSFTLGIGLSVVLGSLITQYATWSDCFWVLLIHGIAMLYFIRVFPETLKQKIAIHPRMVVSQYLKAFRHPRLVIFSLMGGIVSVFSYGYSATAPIYAQINLHLTPSDYGYWNLLNMLGMLASGFLSVHFIKKYGVKNTLLLGIISMVPFLISLLFLSSQAHANTLWFFITTTFLYLFCGLLFSTASYFASNAIEDRASASSAMSFINMGLATVSVIAMGYLPFPAILSFTIILCLLFVLITALVLQEV